MIRKLLLLCALVALSNVAYGLGLGDIDVRSGLNQQFEAQIVLTNVRDLEVEEILPGLASQADFERVGIERNYLLTDLRFTVVQLEDGQLAVNITSRRPIIEPYLNFIVEVLWPTGRILREYTVLLDPPVFGEEGVQRLQPAQSMQAPASPAPQPAPAAPRDRRLEEGTYDSGEYGMTGPGDTLWAIALKTRPNDSVSVQQMMLALQRENPEAFINNNINLLKAGYVLRIPDIGDIRQETASSAIESVRLQNEEFEEYRGVSRVAQLDATSRDRTGTSTAGSRDEGELRLVASGGSSGSRAGEGGSARNQQLEDELAVAKEDLDRTRRANSELNGRISDLEEQLATMDEMIKLKEDQLATLRASVQRMQAESASAPAATPKPAQTASSGSLLTNPFVLGGLALLVVGGAVGGLVFMRRRKQSDEFDDDVFAGLEVAEEESGVEESAEEESAVSMEEEEEDESPQTDVLSEAEIYIAYGRFPQAITFLQNAIENEPNRADIQLKLLEVYTQTEDATAFNLQLEQLKLLGDDDAIAKATELQDKIPGAAETAAASMDATIVASEPIAPVEEAADDDDDLSFDLDDLDAETEDDSLDLDLDDSEEMDLDLDLDADESSEEEISLDGEDLDLDLEADSTEEEIDLDLGGDEDDTAVLDTPVEEAADDDEIDLDLGDDDLDLDLGGDDDDLDLDLDSDDDDDAISLDLDDADLEDADLESELEAAAESSDDDLDLELDSDDTVELNLDDDDLDLGDDDLDLGSDDELSLDADDDAIELDLGDDDDDALDLDLGDDDELDLGGDDDDALDLGLDDDDDLELNLDEDASTKLDLARAYIDMGDNEGAKKTLEEVINEGSDEEVQQANELLSQID